MGAPLPVACTLTDADVVTRRQDALRALLARGTAREIQDGWEVVFPGDVALVEIAMIVEGERECCSFLRFEIVCAEGMGPMTLRVRGPDGTRDFLREWMR
jgi:hypothetical protein